MVSAGGSAGLFASSGIAKASFKKSIKARALKGFAASTSLLLLLFAIGLSFIMEKESALSIKSLVRLVPFIVSIAIQPVQIAEEDVRNVNAMMLVLTLTLYHGTARDIAVSTFQTGEECKNRFDAGLKESQKVNKKALTLLKVAFDLKRGFYMALCHKKSLFLKFI